MGTIITLPGPGIQPIHQGDLDGLCGLYAAINGISLTLARSAGRTLSRGELRRLFSRGVSFLANRHQLTCAVLCGFEEALWPALVETLTAKATNVMGVAIHCSRPLDLVRQPTVDETFWLIEEAVRNRQPVLLGLDGWYDHYTVVKGCTPTYLQLFDSGNLHRLARSACGVDQEHDPKRHIIRPGSVTVVEAG